MHKYEPTKNTLKQDYLNINEYKKINDEIKEFINMQEKKPEEIVQYENTNQENNNKKLINLLDDLLNVYKEIHLMLESKDFENVKTKILNSDIKNALVCESLMKILKDECTEKNEKIKELEEEKNKEKKLIDEMQNLKMKVGKLESEIVFTNRSNNELNRLVKDQKNLLISAKQTAELERKNCESIKSVNKELEILRNKAYEKCKTYEKEISVIKNKLNEKDETCKKLQNQIKNIENEKTSLLAKNNNLEKLSETLKKKLEAKEHTLNMCNEELAKLINKEKKVQTSLEDTKEKASYYERLYKATNKQNEYLNSQLAKMINLENADKLKNDSVIYNHTNKKIINKLKKYKKKYNLRKKSEEQKENEMKSLRDSLEKLKFENKKLQEDKEQIAKGNENITNTLANKVDYLLEKNKEYQNRLIEQTSPEKCNESFKTLDDPDTSKVHGKPEWNQRYDAVNKDDVCISNGFVKIKDHSNSTMFYEDTYRRPFNLENEYEDSPKLNIKDLQNNNFSRNLAKNRQMKHEDLPEIRRLNNLQTEIQQDIWNKNNVKDTHDDFIFSVKPSVHFAPNKKQFVEEDARSTESVKSIKTTSSIKDMLKKTEDLQGRFEILEKQLDGIKERNEPENKKLHDQIKAYTDYYYSDYLDLSNDNDIL